MYRARIPLAAAAVVAPDDDCGAVLGSHLAVERRARRGREARGARAGDLAVARSVARHRSHQRDRQAGARRRVRRHLRQEGLGRAAPGGVRRGLGAQRRASRPPGDKADLVAVVGANGHVVSRDLNINAMYDDDLKARYPSVGKALDGVANKDVWNFDGHLYRVGAAPIRSRAGAVVGRAGHRLQRLGHRRGRPIATSSAPRSPTSSTARSTRRASEGGRRERRGEGAGRRRCSTAPSWPTARRRAA